MPNEFPVAGEHHDDNTHVLVIGVDGQYYGCFPEREEFSVCSPERTGLCIATGTKSSLDTSDSTWSGHSDGQQS